MKKQEEEISKKYDFFGDNDNNKDFLDDASIQKESDFPDDDNDDVLIKQISVKEIEKIDERETIPYASPRREKEDEIHEKIYKESKLETTVESEKQVIMDEEKFMKIELDANKVGLKTSKELK